jgi:hypothetical protein
VGKAGSGGVRAVRVGFAGGDTGGLVMEPTNLAESRHWLGPCVRLRSPRKTPALWRFWPKLPRQALLLALHIRPSTLLHRGSPSRCSLSGSASVAMRCLFRLGVTRGIARAPVGKPVIGRGKQPRRRDSGSRPDAAPLAAGGPFPSIRLPRRLYVQDLIGGWPLRAKSGHSPGAWRRGQVDLLLPFKIGPVNGRQAGESGLRRKA